MRYSHHCPLLHFSEIIPGTKVPYSELNKTNGIKTGLQLYNLWQIHGQPLNFIIANSKTPLSYLAFSSVSIMRQAMGFQLLCHILSLSLQTPFYFTRLTFSGLTKS